MLYENHGGARAHCTCILVNDVDALKIAGEPHAVKRLMVAFETTFGKLEV